MPPRLNAPVLTLDAGKVHNINPMNVESMFGMWAIFSRCSQTIEEGRRLENIAWRTWAREMFSCRLEPEKTIVPDIQMPPLSSSPTSSDAESCSPTQTPGHSPRGSPQFRAIDQMESALSKSRGKEPHLTPETLEKIVVKIQEAKSICPLPESMTFPPLQPGQHASGVPQNCAASGTPQVPAVEHSMHDSIESNCTSDSKSTDATNPAVHRDSETSVSSDESKTFLNRNTSVVKGFTPLASSYSRSSSRLHHPAPSAVPAATKAMSKVRMFQLGGSSEDESSSFEQHMSLRPPHQRSSLSQSLTKARMMESAVPGHVRPVPKSGKTTSFREVVEARQAEISAKFDEGAIESSDEEDDDDVSDSAIEEDEDEEWEDSTSDHGELRVDNNLFKRVDSRANLVSRPSMLTAALSETERQRALLGQASKSTPALRRSRPSSPQQQPSMGASPNSIEDDEDQGMMMMSRQHDTSGPQPRPIVTTPSNTHAMAHSPRTTRRKMLSTELTQSLRQNLLWERQQKSSTVNAVLKRQNKAQSMANLHESIAEHEESLGGEQGKDANSWNHYFDNPWDPKPW